MPAGESNTSDARILLMLNMVTPKDLVDDQEYGNIYKDVKEECSQYSAVEHLHIPRPVKKDKIIRGWRDSLPVCSRRTVHRRSRWCRAGVCQVYRCA